jgi:cytochrome c oxidase assembly factor CtaG
LTAALCVAALIYYRGWVRLRHVLPTGPSRWSPYAFAGGLFALWAAIGSPLAELDEELLSVHMAQHILLSLIAAPLILLGAPALPLLHGMPRLFKLRSLVARLLRSRPVRTLGRVCAQPAICWSVALAVFIGWHLRPLFQLALRSESFHAVEHVSFLGSGLLFWWPVIQPWPSTPRWPRWSIPPYLFAATLPCDGLSAFLTFSDRVVYPAYLSAPRHVGVSALEDQACAGALMWLCVTIAYVIPAAIVTTRLLSIRSEDPATDTGSSRLAAWQPTGVPRSPKRAIGRSL